MFLRQHPLTLTRYRRFERTRRDRRVSPVRFFVVRNVERVYIETTVYAQKNVRDPCPAVTVHAADVTRPIPSILARLLRWLTCLYCVSVVFVRKFSLK